MIVVDASVAIAFLDSSDPHHRDAVKLIAESADSLWMHPLTIAEVLVHPTRVGRGEQAWADLVAMGVKVDPTPVDPHRLAEIRVVSGCKMPDCCVLVSASNLAGNVLTFDAKLAAAAQRMVAKSADRR